MTTANSFLNITTAEWDNGKEYNWALIVDGDVVGSFGLMDPIVGDVGMGMGYWLATPVTGRGRATKAAGLVTKTAFELGAEVMQIWHHVDNTRSKAIPKRLDYRFFGKQLSPRPSEQGLHEIWQMKSENREAGPAQ